MLEQVECILFDIFTFVCKSLVAQFQSLLVKLAKFSNSIINLFC